MLFRLFQISASSATEGARKGDFENCDLMQSCSQLSLSTIHPHMYKYWLLVMVVHGSNGIIRIHWGFSSYNKVTNSHNTPVIISAVPGAAHVQMLMAVRQALGTQLWYYNVARHQNISCRIWSDSSTQTICQLPVNQVPENMRIVQSVSRTATCLTETKIFPGCCGAGTSSVILLPCTQRLWPRGWTLCAGQQAYICCWLGLPVSMTYFPVQ